MNSLNDQKEEEKSWSILDLVTNSGKNLHKWVKKQHRCFHSGYEGSLNNLISVFFFYRHVQKHQMREWEVLIPAVEV